VTQNARPLLGNRDFVLVWVGQSVAVFGDALFSLALMWWVVAVTGSGAAMSAVAVATALPRIILGPLVGVYIDRSDRRLLMMAANGMNAAISVVMAALFWQGIFSLQLIIVCSLLIGVVATLHVPAFDAAIPALVGKDDLVRANSLMESVDSAVGVITPAISGVILALAGVGASIMVKAIAFLIAALSLVLVRIPRLTPCSTGRRSFLGEAGTGFRYLYSHRLLMPTLVFISVVNLALAPLGVVLPIMILHVLGAGPALLGLFGTFNSVGILGASSLLSAFPGLAKRTGFVLITTIIGIGLSATLVGFSPHPVFLLAGAIGLGSTSTVANIAVRALWQREIPDELRGRVFAARYAVGSGLFPVGLAMAGPLADLVGARLVMGGAGLICALVGSTGFLIPGLPGYPATVAERTVPAEPG
jgi:MFS family permease